MSTALFGGLSVDKALAFEPDKPINFIIMAGKGGGADKMARLMQAIIEKEKMSPRPLVPTNKSGGSGAEALVAAKGSGDPDHTIMARVAEALIAAAGERPQIGRDIAAWIRAFVEAISEQLRADHPDAAATDVEVVASGIAGLYFTVDSIASLAEMQDLRMASRQSAHRLAASLGERRNP